MPALGRFAAVDPQAAKFSEWSSYSYTLNNPLALVDPDGECPIPLSSCVGRQGADLAAGFTPGVSTAVDAATVFTGRNPITGERVGLLGRGIALVGLVTPLSGGQIRAGRKVVEAGAQVARHADEARDATRVATKLGDDAATGGGRADFVVGSDGTAVPVSQSRMREGFDQAGIPSRPATGSSEAGRIHTVDTPHGPVDVRTMEGGSRHPRRAVTTRAGTTDPVRITGQRFRRNEPRPARRAESHLEQTP